MGCFVNAKQDHRVENQPTALEQALNITSSGVLKQKESGFVYLDISNEFITQVLPLLEYPGQIRKIPTSARSLGAHISVFVEKENIYPNELNSNFNFTIKEIRSFTMHTRDGLKKLWVIAADAPELEQLREKYGLPPKLSGHDFHITLGKQMPIGPEKISTIETVSSYNFSEEPTVGLYTQGDFITVENAEILETAARVNQIGQLTLKGNGFVYLNVDNQFIDNIVPQLPLQHAFDPISTSGKKMGAHISVIHEDEMIGHEIWELASTGEWFQFQTKEVRYVDRKTVKGKSRLWLLAVDCPALERLRQSHGLKPKLQGHDFHIILRTEQLEDEITAQSNEMSEDEIIDMYTYFEETA